jgi:hypothetical protein
MIWMYLIVLFLLAIIGYIANETRQAVNRLHVEVEELKRIAEGTK